MNYIVLDMEWNQPFNMKKAVKKPFKLSGEIVQIGAVKLDENYHISDTFKIMVSPQYYTKMHSKVKRLTKITNEDLQYGFPFPIAFSHFQKWCGDNFVFFTWGECDIKMLHDNMLIHNIDTDWLPSSYNVQIIFDNQIAKENRQLSLLHAMEQINEPPLVAHDALNDARNTACVCMHLDMIKGLSEYTELKTKYEQLYNRERNELTAVFSTRTKALNDPNLINFCCPVCSAKVVCTGFLRQNCDKFICIGKCENGDKLFVRFKFKKWKDGMFTVSRIIYEMDNERMEYYLAKMSENLQEEKTSISARHTIDFSHII